MIITLVRYTMAACIKVTEIHKSALEMKEDKNGRTYQLKEAMMEGRIVKGIEKSANSSISMNFKPFFFSFVFLASIVFPNFGK